MGYRNCNGRCILDLNYYKMKKIFPFLMVILLTAGCSKDAEAPNSVTTTTVDPAITSVTWKAVYAGANASTQFTVGVRSDSNLVESVTLFIANGAERWKVKKPHTGTYIMYDHIGDEPNGSYYFFVFIKKDGKKIALEPFKVY